VIDLLASSAGLWETVAPVAPCKLPERSAGDGDPSSSGIPPLPSWAPTMRETRPFGRHFEASRRRHKGSWLTTVATSQGMNLAHAQLRGVTKPVPLDAAKFVHLDGPAVFGGASPNPHRGLTMSCEPVPLNERAW